MKKLIFIVAAIMMLSGIAFAISSSELEAMFDPNMDRFSAEEAMLAGLPEGLTEREAEIYRMGYANGHYAALHPEHIEGMYVLNTRTKKFHYSDCLNTLLIDTPNREHSFESKEYIMAIGYDPCGSCKP